jgi:YidC/Oxa1 family membrane protein insertase
MNPFQIFFTYFLWQPQINILRFAYEQTHEMAWSIVILAVVMNIPIWYLYFKSFPIVQKTKALSSKMRALQAKYKEDPLEMRKQLMEFNKKHGINNSATFLMIFFQLFVLTVLYSIIHEIGTKDSNYLYSWAWGSDTFRFPSQVFGGSLLTDSVQPHLWIVVLTSINAYLHGMIMFKWGPQIKIKPDPNQTEEQRLQAETMEKSQTFIGIYFTPIIFLVSNYYFPLGLNIYNLASTTLTLFRLLITSIYYRNHTKDLIKQMEETDPDESDIYTAQIDGETVTSRDPMDNVVDVVAKVKTVQNTNKKVNKKKRK